MKKKMSVLLTVVLVLSLICALVACNDKPQSDGKCTHDYEVTETVSATCLAAGKTTYKCKLCGEGYSEDINALGHNMPAEWNTVEDATCAKNGKKERKCSRCDYKENQVVQMLPHDYKEISRQNADCTTDGFVIYQCDVCDDEYKETLTAGHTRDTSVEPTVTSATCTEDGYTTYHCSVCGQDYDSDFVDAFGHDYKPTSEKVVPTCDTEGYTVYKCSRCDDSKQVFESGNSRLAHNFVDGVCSVCNKDALEAAPFIGGEGIGILRGGESLNSYTVYNESRVANVYVERGILEILASRGYRSFNLFLGAPEAAGRMFNYTVLGCEPVAFNDWDVGLDKYGEVTFADSEGNLIESMFADGGSGNLQIEIQWGTAPQNESSVEFQGYWIKLEYIVAFDENNHISWVDADMEVDYDISDAMWKFTGEAGKIVTIRKETVANWIEKGNNRLTVAFRQKAGQNTTFDVYLGGTVEGTRYNFHNNCIADNLVLSDYVNTGIVFLIYYAPLSGESDGYTMECSPFDMSNPINWVSGDFGVSYDTDKTAWQIDGGDGKPVTISKDAVAMWIEQGYTTLKVDFYSKENQATGFAAYLGGAVDAGKLYQGNGICTADNLVLADYVDTGIVFLMYLNNLNQELICDGYMIQCTPRS